MILFSQGSDVAGGPAGATQDRSSRRNPISFSWFAEGTILCPVAWIFRILSRIILLTLRLDGVNSDKLEARTFQRREPAWLITHLDFPPCVLALCRRNNRRPRPGHESRTEKPVTG